MYKPKQNITQHSDALVLWRGAYTAAFLVFVLFYSLFLHIWTDTSERREARFEKLI